MAMYESVCLKCMKQYLYTRPVADRDLTPICCGAATKRKLSAPAGYVDTPAAGRNTG